MSNDLDSSESTLPADTSGIPRLTNALIGAYIGFFFGDLFSGGQFSAVGLLIPAFVWEDSHVSRLLFPAFMHADILHLAINTMLLMAIGPIAERLYGRARLLFVYLAAGIAGSISSLALLPEAATYAGSASSLGVAGLLLGLYVLRGEVIPDGVETRLAAVVGVGAATLLVMGMFEPLLNNVVQVGGLVTGFLLSTAIEPVIAMRRTPWLGLLSAAAVLTGVTTFYMASRETVVGTLPYAEIEGQNFYLIGDMVRGSAVLEQALQQESLGSAATQVRPLVQNELAWFYVKRNQKLDEGITLSRWSNRTIEDQPAFLDTLGYLYALKGSCREASDAMGRAAALDPSYQLRRDEVIRACDAGERPNTELPVEAPAVVVAPADDPIKA